MSMCDMGRARSISGRLHARKCVWLAHCTEDCRLRALTFALTAYLLFGHNYQQTHRPRAARVSLECIMHGSTTTKAAQDGTTMRPCNPLSCHQAVDNTCAGGMQNLSLRGPWAFYERKNAECEARIQELEAQLSSYVQLEAQVSSISVGALLLASMCSLMRM